MHIPVRDDGGQIKIKIPMMSKYLHTTIYEYINEHFINGHELPDYWYHGTNLYFDKFVLDDMGKNYYQSILGVYFSQYLKPGIYGSTAKEYAENAVITNGGKPYIYKCKINVKKPLILDSNGWYSTNVFIDKNRNDIKNEITRGNYDCVIAYDFDNKKNEGLEYADCILATSDLDIIEIVDTFELK